jgi:predicted HTH transcriptional regulator
MSLQQPDLFTYPRAPGFKAAGTSRTAAEKVRPQALTLREQVLALLQRASLTADECAAKLDKSILSIRPRLSELLALGKIYDTGRTRANASGIQATVWKANT